MKIHFNLLKHNFFNTFKNLVISSEGNYINLKNLRMFFGSKFCQLINLLSLKYQVAIRNYYKQNNNTPHPDFGIMN